MSYYGENVQSDQYQQNNGARAVPLAEGGSEGVRGRSLRQVESAGKPDTPSSAGRIQPRFLSNNSRKLEHGPRRL
jgi:hypothetical protein